ncbi:hypothetical protein IAU59_007547 [Kwoniella sp. CBS 9459]
MSTHIHEIIGALSLPQHLIYLDGQGVIADNDSSERSQATTRSSMRARLFVHRELSLSKLFPTDSGNRVIPFVYNEDLLTHLHRLIVAHLGPQCHLFTRQFDRLAGLTLQQRLNLATHEAAHEALKGVSGEVGESAFLKSYLIDMVNLFFHFPPFDQFPTLQLRLVGVGASGKPDIELVLGEVVIAVFEVKPSNVIRNKDLDRLVRCADNRDLQLWVGHTDLELYANVGGTTALWDETRYCVLAEQMLVEAMTRHCPLVAIINYNSYLLFELDDATCDLSRVDVSEIIYSNDTPRTNASHRSPLGFVLGTVLLALVRHQALRDDFSTDQPGVAVGHRTGDEGTNTDISGAGRVTGSGNARNIFKHDRGSSAIMSGGQSGVGGVRDTSSPDTLSAKCASLYDPASTVRSEGAHEDDHGPNIASEPSTAATGERLATPCTPPPAACDLPDLTPSPHGSSSTGSSLQLSTPRNYMHFDGLNVIRDSQSLEDYAGKKKQKIDTQPDTILSPSSGLDHSDAPTWTTLAMDKTTTTPVHLTVRFNDPSWLPLLGSAFRFRSSVSDHSGSKNHIGVNLLDYRGSGMIWTAFSASVVIADRLVDNLVTKFANIRLSSANADIFGRVNTIEQTRTQIFREVRVLELLEKIGFDQSPRIRGFWQTALDLEGPTDPGTPDKALQQVDEQYILLIDDVGKELGVTERARMLIEWSDRDTWWQAMVRKDELRVREMFAIGISV